MNVTEQLLARNAAFATGDFDPGLSIMPTLKTMIVSCADPRVDPAHLLGLQPGETAVLRNVGGRITPQLMEELSLLQSVARNHGATPGGRFDLIVLHHTDCGIKSLEAHPDRLAAYLGTLPDELPTKAVGDPRAAVAVDVAALRADPRVPRDWVVSGLVYDVHTGRVEVVMPPVIRTA
ncbi:carbonic anhydrase [Deinococcus metalli]|uniref:Carbonic anhydrase n=1 Tax=Deinococcus metalli TaxID=1141878 RepID=A0A7W8KJ81_9DEIO|nr:carbonic anhydrase [Deinococcus metalli]MBB5379127.1 carbonic anhydrase [Deinococcus metalli]GHF65049.1 carbonic anhydrase [Deinococcus metalli]